MMNETNPTEFQTACGGVIKDPTKYPSAEYHGKQVYFCTNACLRVFEQAPDQFMAGEIEHPLEDD
jgi:YHS domain-containing protein